MPKFRSADHRMVKSTEWDPARGAERINDFILMSRGVTNSYVVTSDAGDVMINTGAAKEGERTRERFEQALGRPLKVVKIVLTQDHFDHIGGWEVFADPGSETIVHNTFPDLLHDRGMLSPFFQPRGLKVLHALLPPPGEPPIRRAAPPPRNPRLVGDFHAFDVGGRRLEVYSASSGETLDSLMVWLPNEKVLFTGNWMGALYGALPNFYTLRGDRQRSFPQFMRDLERLIAFEPELMITGHDEPIRGAAQVRNDMSRLLEAVRYIHDETVKGMNAGRDLFSLMREIQLPPHLAMASGRGPVRWYVRAVYEEYVGWFRAELTTELYAVPPSFIWAELAEMAGGPEALAARAQRRLAAGAPVEALHFVEIALEADPHNRAAREAELAALERLMELTEGKPFDEVGWLETKIGEAKAALDGS